MAGNVEGMSLFSQVFNFVRHFGYHQLFDHDNLYAACDAKQL